MDAFWEAGVKQTVSRELASIDERDVRARGRLLHAFSTGWVKGEEEALNKSLGVPTVRSPATGREAESALPSVLLVMKKCGRFVSQSSRSPKREPRQEPCRSIATDPPLAQRATLGPLVERPGYLAR